MRNSLLVRTRPKKRSRDGRREVEMSLSRIAGVTKLGNKLHN